MSEQCTWLKENYTADRHSSRGVWILLLSVPVGQESEFFYSYLCRLPTWATRKTKEGKAFKEDSPQETHAPTKNIKLPFNLWRTRGGDTHLQNGKQYSNEAQLPTEHLTCEGNKFHFCSSTVTLIAVVYLHSSSKHNSCQKFTINA